MTRTNYWPYFEYALKLSRVKRKGLGNMFRHQMETFTILLEYGYTNPVLLKASLIHDLIEDAHKIEVDDLENLRSLDDESPKVFTLVEEVSIRKTNGIEESKKDFLLRIMNEGSPEAKVLKLADRISNVQSLFYVEDDEFIRRYLNETLNYIVPYARDIDVRMGNEMHEIIDFHTRRFIL